MIRKLLSTLTFTIALIAQAENHAIIGEEEFSVDTLFHVTTGPGIRTTGIRLTGCDATNSSINTNVFYTSVDLRNPDLELRGVQALDKETASENVLQMGLRKDKQHNGRYIVGVNGDHANLNGAAKRTNGIALIEGKLYNHGVGDDNWKRYASYVAVEGAKDISITESIELKMPLLFPNGRSHHLYVNSPRHENYMVLYTPEYGSSSKTNPWGRECTLKLVDGSIIAGDAVFEVTSSWVGDMSGNAVHGNMAIPSDGFVLSGHGSAYNLIGTLKIGDRVNIQGFNFKVDGVDAKTDNIIGGCPIIVDNGFAISQSECTVLNKTTAIQITPTARTAIGYDKGHETLFFLVTDSYNTNAYTDGEKAGFGNTSSGLDFHRLANVMIYLGCHTAMAMDGGGSSQLYNTGRGICNIPYGNAGYLRPVANGFFAVSTTPDDNEIRSIEVLQKNVKLKSGDEFTPTVYGYNKYGVLVDTDISDFTICANSLLGSTEGTTFKTGTAQGSTIAIVTHGELKCGVHISTNGGGQFISSGENVNIETPAPYLTDDPAAIYDICGKSGDPIYYNLQGIRVTNPEKGIFISRRDQSTVKVLR